MSIRFSRFLFGPPLIVTLSLGLCVATAQESPPDIGALELENDQAELSFSGNATSYYILYRSEDLQSFAPVGGKLGADAALILLDESLLPAKAFYRVQAVPMDAPLDTDGDGIDDVYELLHPAILDPLDPADADEDPDDDGSTTLEEYLAGSDPESAGGMTGPTTFDSSPGNGADDVAVTRETILRFSRSLARPLEPSAVVVEAAGGPVVVRLHSSPDLRTVTIFYPDGLPGSTSIRVTIEGTGVTDVDGRELDLDGDGLEGGLGIVTFNTLSLTALPGTSVVGRVFASELGDNGVNTPLSGAKITVDGREATLFTFTDAMGNFTLHPCPAGRFFVHIDGRSAMGSEWPDGDYYPFVGKTWTAVAGRETEVGEVYLPLVKAGSLRTVRTDTATIISFADEVVADNPELEGIEIAVPPDALFADDGTRGGMVGIAPVDPNRLPGRLPDALQFPLVITVQTDGPTNFDQPVPVTFPNLPDPVTGEVLPPGAKSALWSFNHDSGQWEMVGPLAVTPRGDFLVSYPGVGILAPGWHGALPGAQGEGGDIEDSGEDDEGQCDILILGPIGGEKDEMLNFATSIRGGEGGTWSWEATGGNPATGSGPEFNVSFPEEGTAVVTVRYVSADGTERCLDGHTVDVGPRECVVSIRGPVEFPEGIAQTFVADVSIPGGRYEWQAESGFFVNSRSTESAEIGWRSTGTRTVHVTYTVEEEGVERTCEDEVTVFVQAGPLRILNNLTRQPIPDGFEIESPDSGNLSSGKGYFRSSIDGGLGGLFSGGGRLTWSGEDAVPATDSGFLYFPRFQSPGTKLVTLRFDPFDSAEPSQTASVRVRVKTLCLLELRPSDINPPLDTDFTVTATVQPPGGTLSWVAPGGTPASGSGNPFQIRYAEAGVHAIEATYRAPDGEECETQVLVRAGKASCSLSITGRTAGVVGDVLGFDVRADPPNGFFSAEVVETGESLGNTVATGRSSSLWQFGKLFSSPGTFTLRVRYETTVDFFALAECSATHTVTITPAVAAQHAAGHATAGPYEGRTYFARLDLSDGRLTRGLGGTKGVLHPQPIRFPANTPFREWVFAANDFRIGVIDYATPEVGESFTFPALTLMDETGGDDDDDGLSALAEFIIGTDPEVRDTDGDGIADGAEIVQGLDPLDGIPTRVGIVASLDLPGTMKDVCTVGDLAVTANGNAGISLINIFNGLDPVEIARIDTPGDAQAIACVDGYIAVADGSAGLAIIRLGDPADTSALTRQLPLGNAVSVEAGAGLAYVGLADGFVVAVDLESGLEAARFRPSGASPIDDLTFGGDVLYAVNAASVMALDPFGGAAGLVGQINHGGRAGVGIRRSRLFAGRDVLYSVHSQGYNTYRFGESGVPQLIADGQNSGAFGWKQIVTNGTGLGIAAVGVNSTADGAHHISLYDVTNPANTNVFVERIETPGLAAAIELSNGLIYVADSEAGLQVVNYLPFDTGDQPPTLDLSTNFAEGVAEENALLTLTADVTDDVQVRTVDFFVEGQKVNCDGSFPFQYRLRVPPRGQQPILAVGALATDTGGNVSSLAELNLTITEDATPPGVRLTIPQDGSRVGSRRESTLSVQLTEPVTESSAFAEGSFQLVGAGADNSFDTADDMPVDGEVRYVDGSDLLRFVPGAGILPGPYRATIGDQLVDLSGNQRVDSFSWSFTVSAPQITSRSPGTDEVVRPFNLSRVNVVFSGEIDGSGVGSDTLQVLAAGPDGALDTADDVRLPGEVRFQLERPDQLSFDLVTQFGLGFGLYQVVLADVQDWSGATVPASHWNFIVDGAVETAVIGRVIDEAGSGIAGVSVVVDNADQATVSAADGTFRVESALVSQISSVFAVSQGGQEVGSKPVGDAHPSRASDVGDVVLRPFSLPLPRVAAGEAHSLVIDPSGRLSGWGINASGEIGDGTMQERFLPSPVAGGARWKTVLTPNRADSDEGIHSLGIRMDGSLWAWGGSDHTEKGLLGIGNRGTAFNEPQPIASDQGWISVGATREHVLGVKEDGTLWAWGENGTGQLGTGDTEERAIPTQIGSDSDWQMVAAGFHASFALKTDGTLWSCGENLQGALGLGDLEPRLEPTRIGQDDDWILVAAGDASNYVVGIKSDLSLWHWGPAVEPNREILSPERLGSSVGWRGVHIGERHVLAVKVDGSLWGWRSARQEGIIGPEIPGSIGEPQLVSPVRGWRDAAVGEDQNVAIHEDGRVIGWGESIYLGVEGLEDGTVYGFQEVRLPVMATLTGRVENADGEAMEGVFVSVDTRDPVLTNAEGAFVLADARIPTGATLYATRYEVATETRFLAEMVLGEIAEGATRDLGVVVGHSFVVSALRPTLACAAEHAFAIKTDGTLWAWGENNDRAVLGDPDLVTDADAFDFRQPVAAQIGLDTDWVSVNSRDDHTMALKENGTLWAWGRGSDGELGISELSRAETPTQVGNETDWAQAVTGESFTVALKTDGSLWAWGRNREGQLGNGSTTVSVVPVRIGDDNDWTLVAAGRQHSLALKTDGSLWAWGDNEFDKLGNASDESMHTSPTQIGDDRDWMFAAAGRGNTFAIKADGTLWGWGENDGLLGSRGLGVGEFSTPVKLFDGVWLSVSWYRRHAAALRADGTLWGWGNNRGGELLGVDEPFEFTNPVLLQPTDNWVRVCAGDEYSIGLTAEGELWSWGNNSDGVLGRPEVDLESGPFPAGSLAEKDWRTIP